MIYFVKNESGGRIKIGTTAQLSQRLKQLAAEVDGNLRVLAVVDGSHSEERALHRRFSHLRVVREWFEPGDDLLGFIVAEGREWIPEDMGKVKLDRLVAFQAKQVARYRGVPVAQILTEMLKDPINKAYMELVQEMRPKS